MKREIGQLWLFAKHYFSLARKLKERLPVKCLTKTPREIADKYPNPFDAKGDDKCVMLMSAHLSSCSLRLCTIDDRLKNNGIDRIFNDKYWRKIDASRTVSDIAAELERDKDKYIHQMLRDNIAHPEREKNKKKENIYDARQQTIEKLTYRQLYDSLNNVVQIFKKELTAKRVL